MSRAPPDFQQEAALIFDQGLDPAETSQTEPTTEKVILSKWFQIIFVHFDKCICPNCKIYLSKLQNIFVQRQRHLFIRFNRLHTSQTDLETRTIFLKYFPCSSFVWLDWIEFPAPSIYTHFCQILFESVVKLFSPLCLISLTTTRNFPNLFVSNLVCLHPSNWHKFIYFFFIF